MRKLSSMLLPWAPQILGAVLNWCSSKKDDPIVPCQNWLCIIKTTIIQTLKTPFPGCLGRPGVGIHYLTNSEQSQVWVLHHRSSSLLSGECMHTHIHTHIHRYTRHTIQRNTHRETHIDTQTHTDMFTQTHMETHIHTHIHIHIHKYKDMHAHTHTCTQTHMQTQPGYSYESNLWENPRS